MQFHHASCRATFVAGCLIAGCIGLMSGCTGETGPGVEPESAPEESLPFAPAGPNEAPSTSTFGPYPVGVRTMTFTDPSRVTEGFEGPRELVTEVWYPAVESARGNVEDYVLHDYLDDDQKDLIPPEALGVLRTQALRDAPPRENATFPVIIFSHGKGGIRAQSTFYTTTLASHGYVVVAPDHQGDTLVDLLNEGDVEITSTASAYIDRPVDVTFLIDTLELLTDDPLAPILDLDRIGMTGHSFGALTSFRAAGFDHRIDAIAAHTPVGIGLVELALEVPVERFGIPIMIESGGEDRTLPADLHADSVWDNMVPPRYYLQIPRAGHFTYSDLCILDVESINDALVDIDVSNVLTDGCGEENIPPERAHPVINHYSVALFNAYLRDSPGSLDRLEAPENVDFGVSVEGEDLVFLAEHE